MFILECIAPINLTKLENRVILDQYEQNVLLSTSFDTQIAFNKFLERCGFKIINSIRTFDVDVINSSTKVRSLITEESFNPKEFTMTVIVARYRDGSLIPMNTIDMSDKIVSKPINTMQYIL